MNTVILDSVPSQANRMEEALLVSTTESAIKLPRLEVGFLSAFPDIGRITTLDAPHRIADTIFRDSLLDGISRFTPGPTPFFAPNTARAKVGFIDFNLTGERR